MPKRLTPQNQWETDFQVPIPGEPRNIGPLELLFQRLLNRTERLKNRIAEILGLPWDATPPDTLSGLHSRVQALEGGQGGVTMFQHRTAPVLDHPDGSVTTSKLADGAVTASKIAPGATPYDIAIFYPGRPGGGATIARIVLTRNVSLTSGAVSVGTAPAANWTATIYKNGTNVGSVSVNAGGSTGTVTLSGGSLSLAEGDVLSVVAPSSPDGSIGNISITLKGVS